MPTDDDDNSEAPKLHQRDRSLTIASIVRAALEPIHSRMMRWREVSVHLDALILRHRTSATRRAEIEERARRALSEVRKEQKAFEAVAAEWPTTGAIGVAVEDTRKALAAIALGLERTIELSAGK